MSVEQFIDELNSRIPKRDSEDAKRQCEFEARIKSLKTKIERTQKRMRAYEQSLSYAQQEILRLSDELAALTQQGREE